MKSASWSQLKQREQAAATVKREDSTAVSHAVEGNSSGSEESPSKQDCTPIHLVRGTPTVQAKLGGVHCLKWRKKPPCCQQF